MTEKPAGAACLKCPARDAPIVLPQLPTGKVRLSVVGESPFRTDFDAGVPFASRGGQLLERGLRTIGLSRNDVHWTNAVLCECKKDDLVTAARQCRRRLHEELNSAGARVVVPTGSLALKSVLRPKSARIQDWRGSISALHWGRDKAGILQAHDVTIEAKAGAVTPERHARAVLPRGEFAYVLPIMHPVFVQRAPEWAPHLEIDVARIGRVLHQDWVAPEHESESKLIIAERNLDCLDALRGDELATDVETTGLGCMSTKLVCFVIADRSTAVIVPWTRDLRATQPWWQNPAEIAAQLSRFWRDRVAVTHNGFAFDHPIFERHGIKLRKKQDTLVGAHALASHLPKKLSHVATTYLDIPPWKTFEHGDSLTSMWGYCGADGLYTARVREHQREELGA